MEKEKEELKTLFAFDCPEHGIGNTDLCFRAFDEKNLNLWKHIVIKIEPLRESDMSLLKEFIETVKEY